MNVNELCASVGRTVPPLFVCSPAPHEGVRVRTSLLYPDGGVVDVFVLERGNGYIVTDFGDALGWLSLQSISQRRSRRQETLVRDVCQTLRIELFHDQLILRAVTEDALGEGFFASRRRRCGFPICGSPCVANHCNLLRTKWTNGCAKNIFPSSVRLRDRGGRHGTGPLILKRRPIIVSP